MRKLLSIALVALCLFSAQPIQAQLLDSLTNPVDSFLNKVGQSLLEYEDKLDIAASKTVITAKQIEERGYDNLDELLSSVQGIYITHDRVTTQVGMRGASPGQLNNQRVLILLDNVPLNDPMSGESPSGYELRGIPIQNIESVTVIRSPMAILYGNSAMLGVIKIKTKKAKKGVGVFYDLGSFGKQDAGLSFGQVWKNTSIALSSRLGTVLGQELYYPELSSFVEKGDQMDYVGLQLKMDHRRFSFNGSYFQREGAIAFVYEPVLAPDSFSLADYETGLYRERYVFADLSYEGPIKDNQSIYARVFLNYQQDEENLDFIWGMGDTLKKDKALEKLWTGVEYEHLFKFNPGHQLLAGGEFWQIPVASYSVTELNGPDSNQDFTFWTLGVFVNDSYQFGNGLAINGGIRIDMNSRTDPVYSPQISVLYTPAEQTTIRAGYSRGYRLPSLLESFVEQETVPLPNANLTPEISNGLDLGLKQQIGKYLNLDLVFYYQQLENLILNNLALVQSDNSGALDALGLEGGLSVNLPKGIQSYFFYNFQFDNTMKLNAPSPLCKFGVTLPVLKHFSVFTEGQYEGSRNTFIGTRTLPYFLMNSNVVFSPKIDPSKKYARWLNQSSISLRVYNVLDEFYQHPSREELPARFITQNGRTWQTKLILQF